MGAAGPGAGWGSGRYIALLRRQASVGASAARQRNRSAAPWAADDPAAADVRSLLAAARREVLGGATVLFSRVMPLDCTDHTAHPLWQLAAKVGGERGHNTALLDRRGCCLT